MVSNNHKAFLELVRAGLWEQDVRLSQNEEIDFSTVFNLAEQQAVTGLVSAGLEHLNGVKVPQEILLTFVGNVLQIEQRNKAMNLFLANLIEKLRENDIYALLVKGQGIAQCYARPLWRSSGDIDLLLSSENFKKAKKHLMPLSTGQKPECNYSKELGLYFGNWSVELHGTLRTGLSTKVDKVIEAVQNDALHSGNVRFWMNGNTQINIPGINNDVFFVFTHFLKHFYKEGGITLRQICDWCRLLWRYQSTVNLDLLKTRLKKAGLMSEWKAFATLAVETLGMPKDAMPLYSQEKKWSDKAELILTFILKGGEWKKVKDTIVVGKIFPKSTLRFLPGIVLNVNWLKIKERLF